MKLWHDRVAAVTQFANLLMGQEMAVGTAVRCMAGDTSVDTRRSMFKYERTILCRMTLTARVVPGAAKPCLNRWTMWIVARRACQNILLQTVALTETEFGKNFLVTSKTGLRARINALEPCGQRRGRRLASIVVNSMTVVAGQPGRIVGADTTRVCVTVAARACGDPSFCRLILEADYTAVGGSLDMLIALAVTRRAGLIKRCMNASGGVISVAGGTAHILCE